MYYYCYWSLSRVVVVVEAVVRVSTTTITGTVLSFDGEIRINSSV